MRRLIVLVALIVACGETSAGPSQSPSPLSLGTATLSDSDCKFEMPTTLPLRSVSFTLINKTRYTGHFGLIKIDDDHTFQNLVEYWNTPAGKFQHASFASSISEREVPTNTSLDLAATLTVKGTYAFHCGYADDNKNVTGFWHELKAS